VSALSVGGSYDVQQCMADRAYSDNSVLLEDPGIYLRPGV